MDPGPSFLARATSKLSVRLASTSTRRRVVSVRSLRPLRSARPTVAPLDAPASDRGATERFVAALEPAMQHVQYGSVLGLAEHRTVSWGFPGHAFGSWSVAPSQILALDAVTDCYCAMTRANIICYVSCKTLGNLAPYLRAWQPGSPLRTVQGNYIGQSQTRGPVCSFWTTGSPAERARPEPTRHNNYERPAPSTRKYHT